jgi:aspartate aminotransferase
MNFNSILNQIVPSASMSKGLSEVPVLANLAVGSPDIKPPAEIQEICLEYAKNPNYAYCQSKGSNKALNNLHQLVFNANPYINPNTQISLCNGAKFGIYLTLKTICNSNDHVMLLQPYWLSYPDICKSLGLQWSGFEYDFYSNSYNFEKLKQELIIENTRVLLLNNPNNPIGQLFTKDQLQNLILFCEKHEIWLVLDEVYKDLVFDFQEPLHEWINSNVVIRVGSLSKSMSLPGMRLAYVQGNSDFIHNFNLFNQHISTCVNSFALYLLENLTKDTYNSFTRNSSLVYKERFEMAEYTLISKGFKVLKSEASFYMMVKAIPIYSNTLKCITELERKGIIVTQGVNYGNQFQDYIRICLTIPKEKLIQTLNLF